MKENGGTVTEKEKEVRRSEVYSLVRLESEMFGGRVIFLRPRQHRSRIPRYRGVNVLTYICVCNFARMCACTDVNEKAAHVCEIHVANVTKKDLKRIKEKHLYPLFFHACDISPTFSPCNFYWYFDSC